jgi:hypothetical protein
MYTFQKKKRKKKGFIGILDFSDWSLGYNNRSQPFGDQSGLVPNLILGFPKPLSTQSNQNYSLYAVLKPLKHALNKSKTHISIKSSTFNTNFLAFYFSILYQSIIWKIKCREIFNFRIYYKRNVSISSWHLEKGFKLMFPQIHVVAMIF